MSYIQVSAEATLEAPAAIVYDCIADYRRHHPRILPKVFTYLVVEEGGVGEGTVIRFGMKIGGRTYTSRAYITEPDPGRVLLEREPERDLETTFTVTPVAEERSQVRIETRWESRGIQGTIERLFAPRYLRKVYAEELHLLEEYARSQNAEVVQPA